MVHKVTSSNAPDVASLRWAVLGGSSGIFRRSLAPAFVEMGQHVVDAASRDGESLEPYADALARSDVDAVYIPLPNHLHAEWIHRALEAGKHVLCEKPLTLSPGDTASVFDHAESAGLVLMEAYMWPHHPRARTLLELVRSRALGSPQWGTGRFSWPMDMNSGDHRLDFRGAGSLFDVGIYCIAPFMMMARREPAAVAANAVRNMRGIDVSMTGWVDWGGGFGSGFAVSFDAPHQRQMDLVCSEAIVEVPGMHTPGPAGVSELVIRRRDESVERVLCDGGNAYALMVKQFVHAATGEQAPVFGRAESERLARVLQGLHAASVH
ncbi:MAG TPA: hypothetical protein DCR14_18750 [Acidimicrobiaceae bacterium]|nr:hypothetical protein [Acidimicrobiaceae bacterium]